MREKLIELLGNVYLPITCGPDTIGEYCIPHKFKKEIADHLIANGVVVSKMETTTKWIPVTERLPEAGDIVLVYGSRGGVYTAYMHRPNYWHKLNSKSHYCNPTHWMPLPEPPKGE